MTAADNMVTASPMQMGQKNGLDFGGVCSWSDDPVGAVSEPESSVALPKSSEAGIHLMSPPVQIAIKGTLPSTSIAPADNSGTCHAWTTICTTIASKAKLEAARLRPVRLRKASAIPCHKLKVMNSPAHTITGDMPVQQRSLLPGFRQPLLSLRSMAGRVEIQHVIAYLGGDVVAVP